MRFIQTFCIVIMLSVQAFAASQVTKASPETTERDFTLSVPTSELNLENSTVEKKESGNLAYELTGSNWSPKNFTRSSYTDDAGAFQRTSTPLLSLNFLNELKSFKNGSGILSRVGFGYVEIGRREEVSRVADQTVFSNQKLSLFILRVGLDYKGPAFLHSALRPYFGFVIMPTYLVGAKSEIEDRISEYGYPTEASLGLIVQPQFLSKIWDLKNGAFGAGVQSINGSVGDSDMSDSCSNGFLRFEL